MTPFEAAIARALHDTGIGEREHTNHDQWHEWDAAAIVRSLAADPQMVRLLRTPAYWGSGDGALAYEDIRERLGLTGPKT